MYCILKFTLWLYCNQTENYPVINQRLSKIEPIGTGVNLNPGPRVNMNPGMGVNLNLEHGLNLKPGTGVNMNLEHGVTMNRGLGVNMNLEHGLNL